MKYLKHCMIIAGLLAMTSVTPGWAQGPLDPTNPPAPSMKTLQEIWDKIAAQQAEISSLKALLAPQANLAWVVTTVDATIGGGASSPNSLTFGPDGQPAISYQYDSLSHLRFARFNGSNWTVTTVDTTLLSADYNSLGFGTNGQPVIAYESGLGDVDLKLARFNGSAWSNEIVDAAASAGYKCSLKHGADGQPAISYVSISGSTQTLMFARFNGSVWSNQVVEAGPGVTFGTTSLAFDGSGLPAIAYQEDTSDILKFTRFNGSSWNMHTVDVSGVISSESLTLGFAPDGVPVIAYSSFMGGGTNEVRYARQLYFETWAKEVVAKGVRATLAFGPDGQPAIAFNDLTDLKLARFNGSGWVVERAVTGSGNNLSLAFGPDGLPALSYYADSSLKIARKMSPPAP